MGTVMVRCDAGRAKEHGWEAEERRVGQSGPTVPTLMAVVLSIASKRCPTTAAASAHRVAVYIDTGPHCAIRMFHGFVPGFVRLSYSWGAVMGTVWYDAMVGERKSMAGKQKSVGWAKADQPCRRYWLVTFSTEAQLAQRGLQRRPTELWFTSMPVHIPTFGCSIGSFATFPTFGRSIGLLG